MLVDIMGPYGIAMIEAREDYFEKINWNLERLRRMNMPIEKDIQLDMFWELGEENAIQDR